MWSSTVVDYYCPVDCGKEACLHKCCSQWVSPHGGPPQNAGVREPLLILSPLLTCCASPAFSGSPTKGANSEVATPPLPSKDPNIPGGPGGPQTRGQSQRWPTSGRKCYVTPAFSGGPLQKGTQTKVAHKRAEVLHQPYNLRVPQTRGQSQRWPTRGRKCCITPAFSGVPKQEDKVTSGPQVGGSATSALQSRGSPNKGTKSKVAHKWAEVLHQPYVLGGPQTRGQSQRWPTSGRKCYATPTFSGGPQTRGQSQRWPTRGRKCCITPAFSGVPKQEDKVTGGPQVGGSATSALQSRGSANKGTK